EKFLMTLFARAVAWFEEFAFLQGNGGGADSSRPPFLSSLRSSAAFSFSTAGRGSSSALPDSWVIVAAIVRSRTARQLSSAGSAPPAGGPPPPASSPPARSSAPADSGADPPSARPARSPDPPAPAR